MSRYRCYLFTLPQFLLYCRATFIIVSKHVPTRSDSDHVAYNLMSTWYPHLKNVDLQFNQIWVLSWIWSATVIPSPPGLGIWNSILLSVFQLHAEPQYSERSNESSTYVDTNSNWCRLTHIWVILTMWHDASVKMMFKILYIQVQIQNNVYRIWPTYVGMNLKSLKTWTCLKTVWYLPSRNMFQLQVFQVGTVLVVPSCTCSTSVQVRMGWFSWNVIWR